MDENENLQAEETEASAEDLDLLDQIFDESWDDDDAVAEELTEEKLDEDTEPAEGEGQPDQPDKEDKEQEQEEGDKTEEGNQLFEINYLGNKEKLTLEQMTELAQKGRNYDHVVEEREKLKGEAGRQKAFLQKLADKAGVSIEEQMDLTEAMWLMDEEAEKGNTLTEAEALLRVQRARNNPEPKTAEEDVKNQQSVMIDRFLKMYPNVKATDISKEVWEQALRTGDLLGAYQAEEIRRLKDENEKTKREVRNEQNAKRSTGPRKSSGSKKQVDDFDAGWDSDD